MKVQSDDTKTLVWLHRRITGSILIRSWGVPPHAQEKQYIEIFSKEHDRADSHTLLRKDYSHMFINWRTLRHS